MVGKKMTPKRVKTYLELRGLGYSQEAIARQLGVSRSLISYHERPTKSEQEAILQSATAAQLRQELDNAIVTAMGGDQVSVEARAVIESEKHKRRVDRFIVSALSMSATAKRLLALLPDELRDEVDGHE